MEIIIGHPLHCMLLESWRAFACLQILIVSSREPLSLFPGHQGDVGLEVFYLGGPFLDTHVQVEFCGSHLSLERGEGISTSEILAKAVWFHHMNGFIDSIQGNFVH